MFRVPLAERYLIKYQWPCRGVFAPVCIILTLSGLEKHPIISLLSKSNAVVGSMFFTAENLCVVSKMALCKFRYMHLDSFLVKLRLRYSVGEIAEWNLERCGGETDKRRRVAKADRSGADGDGVVRRSGAENGAKGR